MSITCGVSLEIFYRYQRRVPEFRYLDLVAAHIKGVVHYPDDSFRNIREAGSAFEDWVREGAYCFWTYQDGIVTDMVQRGLDESTARSAWYTMMLKGFLWHRLHHLYDGVENPEIAPVILPAEWWNSDRKVELGNGPY